LAGRRVYEKTLGSGRCGRRSEKHRAGHGGGTNAGGDEVEATSAREADSTIVELVRKARAAMNIFEYYEQQRVDEVVAWAILRENTEELARLAVEDTGLGNYKYKANKSRRKSLGTLR